MWINSVQLITVVVCCWVQGVRGVEKDIEVKCLDSQATAITEGGVVANCAFQGLTRTISLNRWLFSLANVLQGVNASNNHIKRLPVFPVLPRVLSLNLQHNSIKEIEPRAFAGLSNLQNLDLSHNRVSGDGLKDALDGQTTGSGKTEPLPLRLLFLSHNNISRVEGETFQQLIYLRDLHLDNNPLLIDANFSAAIRSLPELKMLNLASAGLTSLPRDTFEKTQITVLLLNGNQFTQVPDLTPLASSLRLLNINQNPIQELNEGSFSGLHSLMEVVVSGMPNLTKIHNGTFSGLENIQTISCSYNPQLTEVDEFAFWHYKLTKRTSLREVYLNNNALPRIRTYLLPWLKMKKVTLDGNRWVCDCRLHWLAKLLKNRNSTIDRITELKCWEPVWLNGTQMMFWNIDPNDRYENFPCQEELAQERLAEEEEKQKIFAKLENEKRENERREYEKMQQNQTATASEDSETVESSLKLYHLLAIAGLILVVIFIVSLVVFNKYRNYRPIYHVEKMNSSQHNEMKVLNGTNAEKTHLVSNCNTSCNIP